MGGIGKTLGDATGINGLLGGMGLGGEQGEFYQPTNLPLNQMNRESLINGNASLADLLQKYSSGQSNKQDAMQGAMSAVSPDQQQAALDALATGSTTGTRFASDTVQNDPILGQLFGQGGALSRANSEEQDLASRGYQLKPEDIEAYGQASGNIARQFGQQEQSLSQMLADRGLGSAPSGVAGSEFTGLLGNKNEQLARAQTDIADRRMQNNLSRLTQTRNFMSQLGQQGESAINNQYNSQLNGAKLRQGNLNEAAGANNAYNQSLLASEEDKRAAKGKTLSEGFGHGLFSSAVGIGAAPGNFVNSAAGASGKATGGGTYGQTPTYGGSG